MAVSVEILKTGEESQIGTALMIAAADAAARAGLQVQPTSIYSGRSDWLCIFGPGDPVRDRARRRQIERGRRVACWDLGYIGAGKDPVNSYLRVSIDENHPWPFFDATPNDPARFNRLNVSLRDDWDPEGPVIVVGLGPKSRKHLGLTDWEVRTLQKAKKRFPQRRVLYRPKPMIHRGKVINRDKHIHWEIAGLGPIQETLVGTSLVICRHSNVAVDACIANISVECENGAAYWLYREQARPTVEQRLDFLYRLAHWQYRLGELEEAWKFLLTVGA